MTTATSKQREYQSAYRAMRMWWKLVDITNSPAVTPKEREVFKGIVNRYNVVELKAAMESIQMKRTADYYAEFPAVERANRRRCSVKQVSDIPY